MPKEYRMLSFMDDDVEFLPLVSIDEENNAEDPTQSFADIAILPLRNTVLFPNVVLPITVGRQGSLKAVKHANDHARYIGVVAQSDTNVDEPDFKDLYKVGVLARIVKLLKMPDGGTTVIIQGKRRFEISNPLASEPFLKAEITELPKPHFKDNREFRAMVSTIRDLASQIVELSPNIPSEAGIMLKNIEEPAFLINFISSNLNVAAEEKQRLLEMDNLHRRCERILVHMNTELQMLEIKNQIQDKVRGDIDKQQRDFFLHQQLKTIQEELGTIDGMDQELATLKKRSLKKKWPKHAQSVFDRELTKARRMNPAVAEYSMSLNYLEFMMDLPWETYSKDNFDLKRARRVLDNDHYGLDKIKERILEYLAVLKLKGDMKSPILCFVGPPGVGKTSLGRSIAGALSRKHIRMSLGGLHDEAEIRGHRRTYIGALPGRVLQAIRKSKVSNPVFILDEIDKVGSDFRGDPSSALLEVLDPEQNNAFYDNYLELEYDLSKVMFIATANSLDGIQPALRDRMEIIRLAGYSLEEKVEIAKSHLIRKQRQAHGLTGKQVRLGVATLKTIINDYTRESGVRDLDRKLASVMRSVAKSVAMEEPYSISVKPDDARAILGVSKFENDEYQDNNPPGVTIGLAWTPTGGEILFIETIMSKGNGNLTLTGNLGDVMKESVSTALSYIKAHATELNIAPDVFENTNYHVHVPEGAIPKDGPSAGIAMLTALTSGLTGKKVRPYMAMTGEITLRGKVLPVGGVKEKLLAAKRAGIKEIILPWGNRKNIREIDGQYIKSLKLHFVQDMASVLQLALG